MSNLHDFSHIVIYRAGDDIKHLRTGNMFKVKHVILMKGYLVIATTDGNKFKADELLNMTWWANNPS